MYCVGLTWVPRVATAAELSSITYTGERQQALFCCGSKPYNKAIAHMADVIVNSSREQGALQGQMEAATPLQFAWLGDLYPKSWHCSTPKVKTTKSIAQRQLMIEQNKEQLGSAAARAKPGRHPAVVGRRLRSAAAGLPGSLLGSWGKPSKPATRPAATAQPAAKARSTAKRKAPKPPLTCGYKYTDVAAHPFAVLLPYSVHSYGLVQAYSMGLPILAPSLSLLSTIHHATGLMGHKGPGNVPWRSTQDRPQRTFLTQGDGSMWFSPDAPAAGTPCCQHEPNVRLPSLRAWPLRGMPIPVLLPMPASNVCCSRAGRMAARPLRLRGGSNLATFTSGRTCCIMTPQQT